MNPTNVADYCHRSFVWTISNDPAARKSGNAYCIYLHGNLHAENLDVDTFLKMYDSLNPNTNK